ncbi:hypothetical protein FPV67DRAFT_601295 [Lyophyllum atratum]|nr:hypothetical protein FPV67DRAFT_601295 [Lyophyllum atratum]
MATPTEMRQEFIFDGGISGTVEGDDSIEDASSEVSYGEDFREDLQGALEGDFDFMASYYYAAIAPTAPNPCLNIEGLGYVGLPLSARDAQTIIKYFARAPFGHGKRTVMATKVRETWEIEPSKVKFDNPEWATFVGTHVVTTVCATLGVAPSAVSPRCELHKLLLYEPGSHFLSLPHHDTGKVDGIFATIIIVLPSPCTGGQVHVSHSSSTQVIDLAPNSLLSTMVLAWYTEVKHEVEPLTSGYRLALSYNLINVVPGVPRPTVLVMSAAATRLRHVLRKWKKDGYEEMDDNIVAYLLQNEYREADLQAGSEMLKGADVHLVTNLRAGAEELGYMVCLANLEYHVSGYADDDRYGRRRRYDDYPNDGLGCYGRWGRDGDYGYSSEEDYESGRTPDMGKVTKTNLTLNTLVDLAGNLVLIDEKPLHLGEANLIPKEPFEEEAPDETEYKRHMKKGSRLLEHYYRRTALVLLHEKDAPDILFAAGGVHYALQKLSKSTPDAPTADDRKMAHLVLNVLSSEDQTAVAFMSDYALRRKDLGMWKTVTKKSGSLMKNRFGASNYIIRAWKMFTFQNVCSSFEELLRNTAVLNDRLHFIRTLPQHADPKEVEQVQTWAGEQYTRAFESLSSPTIEDIPAIITFARAKGAVFLAQVILPQLRNKLLIYPFKVAFVKALYQQKDTIPEQSSSKLQSNTQSQLAGSNHFDDVMEELLYLVVLEWDQFVVVEESDPGHHEIPSNRPQPPVAQESKIDRVIDIIDLCLLTGRVTSCVVLFLKLLQVRDSAVDKFQKLYTPLVPRLRDLMRTKGVPLRHSYPFSSFLQLLVGYYLRDVLVTPGYIPQTTIRKVGCGCEDCNYLDSFLTGGKAQETFRCVSQRRAHLEDRLYTARDLVTYITTRSAVPHGLEVTKSPEIVATQTWAGRFEQAQAFLRSIGDVQDLFNLMGNRYGDLINALRGAQHFALDVDFGAENLTLSGTTYWQAISAFPGQAVHPVVVP